MRLSKGEQEIVDELRKLERLWKKHGKNLILYNGNSLRKNHPSAENEIAIFKIRGEGGDGGDFFE